MTQIINNPGAACSLPVPTTVVTGSCTCTFGTGVACIFCSSQTWTVPAGITSVRVTTFGGGGAGNYIFGGAGGGSAQSLINVTAGCACSVVVGNGAIIRSSDYFACGAAYCCSRCRFTYVIQNAGTSSFGGVVSATGGGNGCWDVCLLACYCSTGPTPSCVANCINKCCYPWYAHPTKANTWINALPGCGVGGTVFNNYGGTSVAWCANTAPFGPANTITGLPTTSGGGIWSAPFVSCYNGFGVGSIRPGNHPVFGGGSSGGLGCDGGPSVTFDLFSRRANICSNYSLAGPFWQNCVFANTCGNHVVGWQMRPGLCGPGSAPGSMVGTPTFAGGTVGSANGRILTVEPSGCCCAACIHNNATNNCCWCSCPGVTTVNLCCCYDTVGYAGICQGPAAYCHIFFFASKFPGCCSNFQEWPTCECPNCWQCCSAGCCVMGRLGTHPTVAGADNNLCCTCQYNTLGVHADYMGLSPEGTRCYHDPSWVVICEYPSTADRIIGVTCGSCCRQDDLVEQIWVCAKEGGCLCTLDRGYPLQVMGTKAACQMQPISAGFGTKFLCANLCTFLSASCTTPTMSGFASRHPNIGVNIVSHSKSDPGIGAPAMILYPTGTGCLCVGSCVCQLLSCLSGCTARAYCSSTGGAATHFYPYTGADWCGRLGVRPLCFESLKQYNSNTTSGFIDTSLQACPLSTFCTTPTNVLEYWKCCAQANVCVSWGAPPARLGCCICNYSSGTHAHGGGGGLGLAVNWGLYCDCNLPGVNCAVSGGTSCWGVGDSTTGEGSGRPGIKMGNFTDCLNTTICQCFNCADFVTLGGFGGGAAGGLPILWSSCSCNGWICDSRAIGNPTGHFVSCGGQGYVVIEY